MLVLCDCVEEHNARAGFATGKLPLMTGRRGHRAADHSVPLPLGPTRTSRRTCSIKFIISHRVLATHPATR